ncbi:unnamed protein product [Polarella glacialis]|uniref:Uncharacterized protein n=1 Tax=Polarella glacialis TaxID=89957 RepID=A0A813G081_POLGL|nr:unnamed protein product [Polarella glacialis]
MASANPDVAAAGVGAAGIGAAAGVGAVLAAGGGVTVTARAPLAMPGLQPQVLSRELPRPPHVASAEAFEALWGFSPEALRRAVRSPEAHRFAPQVDEDSLSRGADGYASAPAPLPTQGALPGGAEGGGTLPVPGYPGAPVANAEGLTEDHLRQPLQPEQFQKRSMRGASQMVAAEIEANSAKVVAKAFDGISSLLGRFQQRLQDVSEAAFTQGAADTVQRARRDKGQQGPPAEGAPASEHKH